MYVCDFDRCGSSYRGYNYKENKLKGKRNHFELAGGSGFRGFKLSGFNSTLTRFIGFVTAIGQSTCEMTRYCNGSVGSMAIEYNDLFHLVCAEYNDWSQLVCFTVCNGSEYDRYGSVHLVCCLSKTSLSIPSSTIA